jgi:(p)ppGpp synthase/HD superfamily hydrolase
MIHRDDCVNLSQSNPNRRMYVSWEGENQTKHSVKLDIHVIDRVGVLKDVLTKVADCNANLSNTKVKILADRTAAIEVTLEVENLKHLDKVREAIYQINDVIGVRRQRGNQPPKKENR